ncbi:MAG TPA: response regulator transcription factor [Bacteroidales bacterium]|jgi:DNA-binding NarL/FixJ family response regulator|nr:response regulator transcription factor [Bacteroidales bacterium]HOF16351.1 response regulator transcription factor [Bacteroidales bacterium]HON21382.1 response regulator transcription factor [Bacteroidales bacterium]HOR81899.1 response regulator transcription factor [Bacteroidales bacterium]HPJ91131.1 response regulator transcription factor [Bacteroidales bacterium]
MKRQSKILLVESSPIIAAGFTYLLSDSIYFEVVRVLDALDKLHEKIHAIKPDILVVNPSLMDYSKRYMVKSMFREYKDTAVVAFVTTYVEQAVLKQYHAVIEIDDTKQKIESKLHDALLDKNNNEPKENYELSDREKDVLIAVAKGKTNKEIADELCLSIHTVITHRKNINRKTGIKTISGLTVYALLNNLIDESSVK